MYCPASFVHSGLARCQARVARHCSSGGDALAHAWRAFPFPVLFG
jgi:hypothetical protein